ncbi:MAG: hypothetical protein N3A57_02875, partial [Negativicutes bacterium]|nr:hypothetical protein [Negativicutes bacterium]
YTTNISTVFNYDSLDIGEEWDLGLYWKLDDRNSLAVYNRFDLRSGSLFNTQYTYYRNLHCWLLTVQYTNQVGQVQGNQQASWSVDLKMIDW